MHQHSQIRVICCGGQNPFWELDTAPILASLWLPNAFNALTPCALESTGIRASQAACGQRCAEPGLPFLCAQIGVKFKPENCDRVAKPGDVVSVHYAVSDAKGGEARSSRRSQLCGGNARSRSGLREGLSCATS